MVTKLGWRSLCIALLVLGIVFRWVNLGTKVYWHDEAFTSLAVAGYTIDEVVDTLFIGREVSRDQLQGYQHLDPDRNIVQMVRSLAFTEPYHPPFYLIVLRFWLQIWGESIAITRSLSAIASLLVFPLVFWLNRELFQSSRAAWIGLALISVSPFHVLFAQEAREYVGLTVTTLLSSLTLLRALRLQTRRNWLWYGLSLTLGLYTSLMMIPVAVGQGLYVVLTRLHRSDRGTWLGKWHLEPQAIAYGITSGLSILAFSPWLYALVSRFSTLLGGTEWATTPIPFSIWLRLWLLNLSRSFVDFNPFIDDPAAYLPIALVVALEGFALYSLCRQTDRRVWLYGVMLIAIVALPMAIADLVLGGSRATATRYLSPMEIGLQLPMAWWLATVTEGSDRRYRLLWNASLAALISFGILSCVAISQADTWWNKGISIFHHQMADAINQSEQPLLISDAFMSNPGNILALSHDLKPETTFFLVSDSETGLKLPATIDRFQNIFFFNVSEPFLRAFSATQNSEIVNVVQQLWRSRPRP